MPPAFSAEFLLVSKCCIWPHGARRVSAIQQASTAVRNWDRVLRIARRHRVVALVHDGLVRAGVAMPESTQKASADEVAVQAQRNLHFAAETVRINRTLEVNGMTPVLFKGVTTALTLYGELALRHSKDIDIIIPPRQFERAAYLLEREGYQRVDPPAKVPDSAISALRHVGKDFVFVHREYPFVEVELHWRLFSNPVLAGRFGDECEVRCYSALGNAEIRTFNREEEFAYLCLHGAVNAWFRLKWLADIGALIEQEGAENLDRLLEAAAEYGAGRAARGAVLLCARLFGTPVRRELIESLERDWAVRQLERLGLVAMTQGGAETEPYELSFGFAPMRRAHWLVEGSMAYKWAELRARLFSWQDIVDVSLPRHLYWLYPALRLPLWIGRRIRTLRSRT